MLRFAAAVFLALALAGCGARRDGPIVVLISLDGFRWDYLDMFHPPHLLALAKNGVRAERMIPVFPSLTFPNHYSIVTGLRPEHHGIVGNSMFDPEFRATFQIGEGSAGPRDGRWWGGEPVWVTAEKQGVRAACMFWPGSEVEIGGVRPTEWKSYVEKTPMNERVDTVLSWLGQPAATRPRLITLYFHQVDSAGHKFGPGTPEVGEAVRQVDAALGRLLAGVRKLGLENRVNYVVVSDHGMTEVSPEKTIALADLIDRETIGVDFSGAVTGLRPPPGTEAELVNRLRSGAKHFQVYLRDELPERFHFRAHRRIPPVILVADEGWRIADRPDALRGAHGYDPELPSMGALFIASGPAFLTGVTIPPFECIEIYPLLCDVLGLKPAPNDATGRLAAEVRRN